MISLKLMHLDRVFHIGTMDIGDRSRNYRSSYEGNCLSISVTPHAWQQIARLGGYDLHALNKASGQLVDIHAARDSDDFPKIVAWARENNLVEDRQIFKAWERNEDDDWTYSYFETVEDALAELDMDGIYDGKISKMPKPRGHKAIEPITILGGTRALSQILGRDFALTEEVDDFIIMVYASVVMGVDGVWWNEEYDPDGYSAPRGGIFPGKVAEWYVTQINFDDVDDEEELEKLDEVLSKEKTKFGF